MKKSEGNAMEKDIEWLKEEIGDLPITDTLFISDGITYIDSVVSVTSVCDLINQLDEPEKVVVPQFVADEFDYNKNPYWEVDESKDVSHILKCAFGNEGKPSEFLDWVRENPEDYVMAVRNGCEVEEEPLYYALIKGHELIAGEDACKYWKCDMRNGSMFLSNRYSHYGRYLAEMSINDWGKFDINDTNADFVRVDD